MKKYNREKDFLLDSEFIAWRMFRTGEQELYWTRFADEHPACREALEKAIHDFSAITFNDFELSKPEREALYQGILRDIRRRRSHRRSMIYWSAAASIALLVVSSLVLFQSRIQSTQQTEAIVGQAMPSNDIWLISGEKEVTIKQNARIALKEERISVEEDDRVSEIPLVGSVMNKLIVPSGKRSTLQLSDGTTIWLNAGTVLDFPSKFTDNTREISVNGEIYIEVEKGQKPFYVNTSQFRVRVHGTKFNISAYSGNEEVSVVLVEGLVEVITATHEPMMLRPNEKAIVRESEVVKQTVHVEEYISWKSGILIFNHTPISDVLKKVGRYGNIHFEDRSGKKLSTKTCTGELYLSDDFDEIMISLSTLSSTQYHREGNTIYLRNQ